MLTQEYLRENLSYDPETGKMTWIKRARGRIFGSEAGYISVSKTSKRRWFVGAGGGLYLRSRLAWVWMTGDNIDEYDIDHKNRNTIDDRFSNLRKCSHRANMKNRVASTRNISGFRGVSRHQYTGKWLATMDGELLGEFEYPHEAAELYNAEVSKKYGDIALLNEI